MEPGDTVRRCKLIEGGPRADPRNYRGPEKSTDSLPNEKNIDCRVPRMKNLVNSPLKTSWLRSKEGGEEVVEDGEENRRELKTMTRPYLPSSSSRPEEDQGRRATENARHSMCQPLVWRLPSDMASS